MSIHFSILWMLWVKSNFIAVSPTPRYNTSTRRTEKNYTRIKEKSAHRKGNNQSQGKKEGGFLALREASTTDPKEHNKR